MQTLTLVLFVIGLASLMLLACYLDSRYQWRLNDWLNGTCSNPFKGATTGAVASDHQQKMAEKDAKIAHLEERIATLEAIVTEPAYELNQKINALR